MISIRQLLWDDWNIAHISRHEVSPEEVEEVCHGDVLVQQGHDGRVVLIGPTSLGRMLEVVLAAQREAGVYYVVTAHVAGRKDRALYESEKRGSQQ